MKAVLLAAGLGTRLRPITDTIPKCLVPINGMPLLDIWLTRLTQAAEIDEIFINTHYLHEVVEEHIRNHWGHSNNITLWHEPDLLGTAGTITANAKALCDDDVLLIHADNLSLFKLDEFIDSYSHRPAHCDMTMMLFTTDQPQQCGIVELDSQGVVITMHEKVTSPPSNLANAAVYILSRKLINKITGAGFHDFSNQVIPECYGRIDTWVNHHYHRDIGNPKSLAIANADMQSGAYHFDKSICV